MSHRACTDQTGHGGDDEAGHEVAHDVHPPIAAPEILEAAIERRQEELQARAE